MRRYKIQSDKEYYKKLGFDTDIAKIYADNDISFSYFKNGEKIETNDIYFSEVCENDTIVSDDLLKNINIKKLLKKLKKYFTNLGIKKISIILILDNEKEMNFLLSNNFEEKSSSKDGKVFKGRL